MTINQIRFLKYLPELYLRLWEVPFKAEVKGLRTDGTTTFTVGVRKLKFLSEIKIYHE